jgi:hypothetical protein
VFLNIGYKLGVGLGFCSPKNSLIPNYARIKMPNTCPAFKFAQQNAITVTIKDEIKYLYCTLKNN